MPVKIGAISLFWLSLFPFSTGWVGENHFPAWSVAYRVVLLAQWRTSSWCGR
jgi:uncharacterized membrane protein